MSAATAKKGGKKGLTQTQYISTMALIMMNVVIVAGIGNDVQLAFYGMSSITYLLLGAVFFFLPTGLVAAELASGWGERGGIFRWVGEGLGMFPAISCLLILWFQTAINFGSGLPSSAVTIGFFTPDLNWAINFAEESHPAWFVFWVMMAWTAYYYLLNFLATKGVKVFSKITKYGVLVGTFIPLAVMIILAIVWIVTGHGNAMIESGTQNIIPKWSGMSTLALAAGVFFSFAGIDMNAAYIKDLKKPSKQYPTAIFVAMILSLAIFIIGTLIIAMVIPVKNLNLLYSLDACLSYLGSLIGCPWLYLVFIYLGLANGIASMVTNLSGPSYMLGGVGRSGFLPKFLQNNNKHGMPSRLMWTMMFVMTGIALLCFLIPNIEGFVALIDQALTVLYMIYYVFMFLAFIKLRYEQPNRPRSFKVPGGMVGAWIVTIVGLVSCVFASVLAFNPPAQLSKEVGSPLNYVLIIAGLVVGVMAVCFVVYKISRRHPYVDAEHQGWVDPTNEFAPFTWQVEGFKKPTKVKSNLPSEVLAADQNPMGMPIKHPWDPNFTVPVTPGKGKGAADKYMIAVQQYVDEHHIGFAPTAKAEPEKVVNVATTNLSQVHSAALAAPAAAAPKAHKAPAIVMLNNLIGIKQVRIPNASPELVAQAPLPADPKAALAELEAQKAALDTRVENDVAQDEAVQAEIKADQALIDAEAQAKQAAANAAVAQAQAAGNPAKAPQAKAAEPAPDAKAQPVVNAANAATDAASKAAPAADASAPAAAPKDAANPADAPAKDDAAK